MPVHETEDGYKYGETGKTYKNKKDAVKQAIAIAYSKAEKKGRKPSQEEIKNEISGNPDTVKKTASAELSTSQYRNMTMDRNQMLRNYAGRLRKKASALEKQAQWGEWASKAGEWLSNPENLGRLGIGGGTWLASYLASGILDPKKNRGIRALLSGVPAVLAATKGYDVLQGLGLGKRDTEDTGGDDDTNYNIPGTPPTYVKPLSQEQQNQMKRMVGGAINATGKVLPLANKAGKILGGIKTGYVSGGAQRGEDTGPHSSNEQEPEAFKPVVDPSGFEAEKARQLRAEKELSRQKLLRAAAIRQRLADMNRTGKDPYAFAADELTPAELAKRNAPMDIPRIGPDIKGALARERADKGRGFIPTLWSTLAGASNQSKMQRDLDAKIKARNERAALEAELKQLTGK